MTNGRAQTLPVKKMPKSSDTSWRWTCIGRPVLIYLLSSAVVVGGVFCGAQMVPPSLTHQSPQHVDYSGNLLLDVMTQWDGQWYLEIASEGYSYDPEKPSSVAFFPVYPLVTSLVMRLTALGSHVSGLLVSNLLLVGCFIMLAQYSRERFPDVGRNVDVQVLTAFGFFPTTFFFRMAYSESALVFCCLLTLIGIHRKWNPFGIALIVAVSTACRPTGIALIPPLLLYVWNQKRTLMRTALHSVALVSLGCAGLIGYAVYLWFEFGEPLAFVKTQKHWTMRPPAGLWSRIESLVTFEPIWSVYMPSSDAYWKKADVLVAAEQSLTFANPILFSLGAALVVLGAIKRWLNAYESLLCVAMIGIPYLTRSYEMCMIGHGRFICAVVPIYLVIGRMFCLSWPFGSLALLNSALFLAMYSAMLAAGYLLI